ncbi:MAG: hypothetical protein ACPH8A_07810, partial [Flavobacteriaceae bacterium]
MKQFNLLSFLILLVCCSGSDNSSDNTTTQDEVFFVSQSIGGVQVQREVLLHLPNNFDSTQTYPVVIAFHGNGGQNNSWFNQLSQFVDIGEFIGVYPQGYLNSWNLG